MDKKKEDNLKNNQGSIYDKIFRENMEAALPGLIKKVLKINTVYVEELPDDVQFTKERKPDALKKITDDKGETFVLHLEFQTENDKNMEWRMAEYLIMLSRRYKLKVRQYVIYIGKEKVSMSNELKLGESYFRYQIISLLSIDYRLFLRSERLEEKMLALLGNFGKDNPQTVFTAITMEVLENAKGELEKEQRKNQLRILLQLRSLVSDNNKIMESVSTFFKNENDILYRIGEEKGIKKGMEKGIKKGMEKGIEKGMEKGIEKGIINVALNAKRMGMTVADISKLTGLSEGEINKLKL